METVEANGAASETALNDGSLSLGGLAGEFMTDDPPAATPEETPEAEETEQPEEVEVTAEVVETDEEGSEEPESVLSRYGLESLSEEERIELNKELGGRASERFGQLTEQKKQLAAENDRLRQELSNRDPFEDSKADANPFKDKNTVEELREVHSAAQETLDVWEDILDDHRDSASDDEIGEVGGEPVTKRQVRQMLKNARAAISRHIPQRVDELRAIEQFTTKREEIKSAIPQVYEWFGKEGEQANDDYNRVIGDVSTAISLHKPELLPLIDLVIADHIEAARKRAQGSSKPPAVKKTAKRRAPSGPGGAGGAARAMPTSKKDKAEKAERFMETSGSASDLAAFFMPQ